MHPIKMYQNHSEEMKSHQRTARTFLAAISGSIRWSVCQQKCTRGRSYCKFTLFLFMVENKVQWLNDNKNKMLELW